MHKLLLRRRLEQTNILERESEREKLSSPRSFLDSHFVLPFSFCINVIKRRRLAALIAAGSP